jgi:hypothetical protein
MWRIECAIGVEEHAPCVFSEPETLNSNYV